MYTKINDKRQKLLVLCEEDIENYKSSKKSYIHENNDLTVVDTSSEENIQDSDMTQGENKEVVKYDISKNFSD